jgi:hypothetical protein
MLRRLGKGWAWAALVLGVLLALFGIVGLTMTLETDREIHNATLHGPVTQITVKTRRIGPVSVKAVALTLDNGDDHEFESDELRRDMGPEREVPAKASINPADGGLSQVFYKGRWYSSGGDVAATVFAALFTLAGLALVFFAIRRLRMRDPAPT